MKVIVNVAGFYGGSWFNEHKEPQEMAKAVARQFLPPHGDQLALPKAARSAAKADEQKAG